MLRQGAAIAVTGGGSLSLAGLALPAAALGAAVAGLAGAGSTLVFAAVTVPEHPEWGALTGTVTAAADGPPVLDPPGFMPSFFAVLSGPCTTAVVDGHFCVGRWPGGYLPDEDCEIAVAGGVGVLGPCPVFDIRPSPTDSRDYLTLPDGSRHSGADCPAGAALAAGQRLAWHSDGENQGYDGNGLPYSDYGAGGGWQVCFA